MELDEVKDHLKEREMKAKDCMIAASTIAEELHNEQEHSGILEAERKILENKLKDMQVFCLYPLLIIYRIYFYTINDYNLSSRV